MTIISQRKHAMMSFASALFLLLLPLFGPSSGLILQQTSISPIASTRFVRRPISYRQQSTCLWSDSDVVVVGETSEILADEDDQKIISSAAYDWDEQFEELQSFMSEFGHCHFPQNPRQQLEKKYPKLKRFCHHQRIEYKRLQYRKKRGSKAMTLAVFDRDVRCRRLEELGFEFSFTSARWYDHYHELIQYVNDNGHIRVSERDDAALSQWVYNQRSRRNEAESYARLPESQIKLLDDIGFEWKPKLYDAQWNAKYQELVAFRNKHGHFFMEVTDPLYFWMDKQRKRRAGKKGQAYLTDEQIRLLDEIEFPWKPERYDARWYAQYDDLRRFQKEHGHCQPGRSTHTRLYKWCEKQRKKYESESLSKEKIKLLEQIDFPWDRNRKIWNHKYNELCEFCKEHGHLRVSEDGHPDLYEWMATQRQRYHGMVGRAMSDEQIEKLEELHLCWSLDWRDRTWHEKYTEVVEFFKEHGHVMVTEKENRSLYNWIEIQEKRYREVKGEKPLSEEELELLEQLDFPFLDGQPRMAWNAMYTEVERYREENDGRFPTSHKDDRDLNRWIRQQRHRYRCAFGYVPLSDEEKSSLESIDFPMYPEGKQNRPWYEKYDELFEFRKEHGNFLVDRSDNYSLNRWIELQRARFKGTRSPQLSRLQIYLLERIDFPWASDRLEIEWQEMYEELVEFGKEHGHLRVRKSEYPELYRWTHSQRSRYKGHLGAELPQDQIEQLERIGFQWSMS